MPISFLETGDAILASPTATQTISGSVEELILDNSSASTTTNPTLAIGTPLGIPRSSGGIMMTGTSTFSSILEIHNQYANGIDVYTHTSATFRGPVINLHTSGGTQQTPTAVPAGQSLGYYETGGYNGTGYVAGLIIQTIADQTWTSTSQPCHTDFYIGVPNDLPSNVKSLTINYSGTGSQWDELGSVLVWRHLRVGQVGDSITTSGLILCGSGSPTSATTAGDTGQISWDGNNVYICTHGGVAGSATWKAAALSTV